MVMIHFYPQISAKQGTACQRTPPHFEADPVWIKLRGQIHNLARLSEAEHMFIPSVHRKAGTRLGLIALLI
jgi:hypothetical protein